MQRPNLPWLGALCALLFGGCSDDGLAPRASTTGTSGATIGVGTTGGDDDGGGGDTGVGDSGGIGEGCPRITVSVAGGGLNPQRIAIVAVSLTDDTIRLRNVSSDRIPLANWQICFGPDDPYLEIVEPKAAIDPGAELTVHLNATGMSDSDDLYLRGIALPDADELAIYNSGAFTEPTAMEAYVRYGDGGSDLREPIALDHDPPLWTAGEVVTLDVDEDGFVATGPSVTALGFSGVSSDCL